MHELKLYAIFLLDDGLHQSPIFDHLKTFAVPSLQVVFTWYAEIGVVDWLFSLYELRRNVENQQSHGCIVVSFEVVDIFLDNLEQI